jgi:hypothetical protein
MALNNFDNLKASIRQRSRNKEVQDADVEDYILQAEAEMYHNSMAPLRVRSMESRQTASASTSTRFLELPTDFLQMRALHLVLSGGNEDVRYMAPEQMAVNGQSGKPRYFTITTQIEFDKTPDSTYTIEMSLLKKVAALSDANTTNDILTLAPNIYLFGSLWALFQEYQEMDLSEYYYGKFIGAIEGLNKSDRRGRYGPAPKIRIEGATP